MSINFLWEILIDVGYGVLTCRDTSSITGTKLKRKWTIRWRLRYIGFIGITVPKIRGARFAGPQIEDYRC